MSYTLFEINGAWYVLFGIQVLYAGMFMPTSEQAQQLIRRFI